MPQAICMNMNLETISRAREIAKDIRTQICTKGQIFRNSCEAPKMRVFQKNQNGAQDRFYKRNTSSQEALKRRIYAISAWSE